MPIGDGAGKIYKEEPTGTERVPIWRRREPRVSLLRDKVIDREPRIRKIELRQFSVIYLKR